MREERLLRVLSLIDDDLIEEAAAALLPATPRRKTSWRSFATLAACMALVASLGLSGGFRGCGASAPPGMSGGAAPSEEAGSGSTTDGANFLSYTGPVLPLTLKEPSEAVTAERSISLDFAPNTQSDSNPTQWGASVSDSYVLYNSAPEAVTLNALYPVVSSLQTFSEATPTLTVEGQTIDAQLYAGPFAGGYAGLSEGDTSSYNLRSISSFDGYEALLSDGSYVTKAISAIPVAEQAVTVYEFTPLAVPVDAPSAATQAVSFTIDQNATEVLSYGFEGYSCDTESGWRQFSYSVPEENQLRVSPKLLVVLGEDIDDYALQGYANGGCDSGTEIDGVSCTVTRRESTLSQVLERLTTSYVAQFDTGLVLGTTADSLTPAVLRDAVTQLFYQRGPLSDNPAERYSSNMLEDFIMDALGQPRVLYLSFQLAIPAESSVTVETLRWQAPNYDFGGSGTGREGLQGYELATSLGSSLRLTTLDVQLLNADGVQITEENLGLTSGQTLASQPLDVTQSRYYLTVQPIA